MENFKISEALFELQNDDSWEENPEMRAILVMVLTGTLISF